MKKVYTTTYEKDILKIRRAILRHDRTERDRGGTVYRIGIKLYLKHSLEHNSIVLFTEFHEADVSATQKAPLVSTLGGHANNTY